MYISGVSIGVVASSQVTSGSGFSLQSYSVLSTTQDSPSVNGTVIPWDTAEYDPDGWFDLANNRFVVPSGLGIEYVVVNLAVKYGGANPDNYQRVQIRKNSAVVEEYLRQNFQDQNGIQAICAATASDAFDSTYGRRNSTPPINPHNRFWIMGFGS